MWFWYLAFLAIIGGNEAKLIRLPLYKQNTKPPPLEEILHQVKFVSKKNDTFLHQLSFPDVQYYAYIRVGTPPQKFKVTFDSLTPHFWLTSKYCINCVNQKKYDSSQSSTYRRNDEYFSVSYIVGEVTGVYSIDTVRVGRRIIHNQIFGEGNDLNLPRGAIAHGNIDGVFGFSFDSIIKDGPPTLLYNMFNHKPINQHVVSFYINRDPTCKKGEGEIIFGGSDHARYVPPMTYTPATSENLWEVKMDRIVIGNVTLCEGGCKPLIATGYPFIRIPNYESYKIIKTFGATRADACKFRVLCHTIKNFPTVDFVINGVSHTLDYMDYVTAAHLDYCYLAFEDEDPKDSRWILGTSFLKKFYTEFDFAKKRVGFARLK